MKLLLIILSGFIISACSSTGMRTASHNGLAYNFPDKCSKYEYYRSDESVLYCIHNGQLTGESLHPASRYKASQKQTSQEQTSNGGSEGAGTVKSLVEIFRVFGEALNQNTPKTTYTNCYGGYGSVNCTSTTP